jgi:hypothetical protein
MRYINLESDARVNLREELAEAEHLDDAFDSLYGLAEIKTKASIHQAMGGVNNREALNTWGTHHAP